jgi:hypothetical protein
MGLKRQFICVASLIAANLAVGFLARQIVAAHQHDYPKTCQPGMDCAAATWLLLFELPIYLGLSLWMFGLVVVVVARSAKGRTLPP